MNISLGNSKLRICYAAPGQNLVATSGPTSNVLSLSQALSEYAEVTVAFRTISDKINQPPFRILEIEPDFSQNEHRVDHAKLGIDIFGFRRYIRVINKFANDYADQFDCVLEKSWRGIGLLGEAFAKRNIPYILVENSRQKWTESIKSLHALGKYLLHHLSETKALRALRHAPSILVETLQLKEALANRGVPDGKIHVAHLGVNHDLFYPRNQSECRRKFKIAPDKLVMLYVGGLDKFHDLRAVIKTVIQSNLPNLEFHIVGDGPDREEYKQMSEPAGGQIKFAGKIPHEVVPEYISAVDLCIAPYNVNAFPSETITFSTLKIPEYMACAKPVISVPNGHILDLIETNSNGFLFDDNIENWSRFLAALPSQAMLREMGKRAADSVAHISWQNTARDYYQACVELCGTH